MKRMRFDRKIDQLIVTPRTSACKAGASEKITVMYFSLLIRWTISFIFFGWSSLFARHIPSDFN